MPSMISASPMFRDRSGSNVEPFTWPARTCSSPATLPAHSEMCGRGSRWRLRAGHLPPDRGERFADDVELASHRVHPGRAILEHATLRGILELTAAPGELVGAKRRGVGLQRVGCPANLLRIAGVETGAGGG